MKKCRNRFKKPLYIAFLLIFFTFFCTGCNERVDKQQTYREKGITLMENGKYAEALVEFQNALDLALGEVGETEADICFYKAEAQYHLGDIDGAMATYSAIIEFNDNPKAYFLRGNLYYSLENEAGALLDYADAVKHDAKNYEVYIGVYEALAAHGNALEGQAYLNDALEIKGNTSFDKIQKGRIYFLLGDVSMAISLLEEAIAEKETDGYFYLAEIQESIGDTAAAQESIAAYIESGKLDSYHLFHVANSQIEKGHFEMAIVCLNKALALENVPNKQTIMKSLVIAYEQNRDFASAKQVMAEYIAAYPDDEEAKREFTFLETR